MFFYFDSFIIFNLYLQSTDHIAYLKTNAYYIYVVYKVLIFED